ncbi:MAG: YfiR family protein [Ignavibacteriae bacterium]|nr:YfiR family protein [Ignavibacteriota bacterium]
MESFALQVFSPLMALHIFMRISYIVIILLFSSALSITQTISPTEYQVKAAFLYNFAKFVEWSPETFSDTTTPIVIGILGEDPFEADLDTIVKDKNINGREFVVRRFQALKELEQCHILFISSSEQKDMPKILRRLRNSGMLTVSEVEHFAHIGGMINLVVEENKVRFEINVEAAEREGLKISSQLLKLARIVSEKENN